MMRRRARRCRVLAHLNADQLLELIEETSTALAESARGADAEAIARFDAVVARLGIAADIERISADQTTTPKEGNR